ncbi:MAG: Maf family protein, partial [Kiritimatiellaeota bacterium]|nr:Maf family protein [Kiritimatiellota bacterium]
MKIIAATASPRRHAILRRINADFEVAVPDVEEIHDGTDPVATVVQNARAKYVASRATCHDDTTAILAADTLVWFEGELIGKPR